MPKNNIRHVPGVARVETWENGEYVHVQAGEDSDEWVIAVTGPVRSGDGRTKQDAITARCAVKAGIEAVRRRERKVAGGKISNDQ